jgi:hypothetical protein
MTRLGYSGPPPDFQSYADLKYTFTARCQQCWHTGPTLTPAGWADRFGVPMTTPVIHSQHRLKCGRCGARAGYLHIEIPGYGKWRMVLDREKDREVE